MQKCICKKKLKCFYLTKDNYEELLELDCPNYRSKNDYIKVKVTDKEIIVESYEQVIPHVLRSYRFGWWVGTVGYSLYVDEWPTWEHYTDKEFEKNFMIIH